MELGRDSVITVAIDGGVAVLMMGGPSGRGVNLVDERLLATLARTIDALDADDQVIGAVLASADNKTFLAGGDVAAFLEYQDKAEVIRAIESGNEVLRRIETWRKPLVAAVNGACLGGGTELALAAARVVATDSSHTRFALPEVKLGLLPGLGGTVRLPRRVGLLKALDVMVSGRNVYPDEALASGLVAQVVQPDALIAAAREMVVALAAGRDARPPRLRRAAGGRSDALRPGGRRAAAAGAGSGARAWPLPRSAARLLQECLRLPLVLDLVLARARSRALAATRGNYPAPPRMIDAVGAWARRGRVVGERAAATAFADLLFTPQARALIRLFFATSAARKNPWAPRATRVARVAVLGAGLMGGGIAEVSARAGLSVRIKDSRLELAEAGRDRVAAALAARVGKGLTQGEADSAAARVMAVASYAELAEADITIEAVLEDLELKRTVLAEIEAVTSPGHLFASNTSAIRIEELAATAERPEAVVGMHYFSPVPKMQLLEIVVTRRTEEWAVATATALGLRQGKAVIVVLDGPGFYTTRVLTVFMAEALLALSEGVAPAVLERALVQAGFPLGPLALMDDVGIDTGAKIEAVLEPLLAERGYAVHPAGAGGVGASARLAKAGFLGRKAHKGFYLYEDDKRTRQFDVRAFLAAGLPLPIDGRGQGPTKEVTERLLLTFAREAVLCLQEGVLRSPRDGDVGAVLGLGFPPFLGGPFGMLDTFGLPEAVERFAALGAVHGARFSPPGVLVDMAAAGQRFYPVRSVTA